jgi:hypothetical protein
MNTLVIVLGVMLVVIIMASLFSKFLSGETTLVTNVNLSGGNPNIPSDKLTSSQNRTYGILIYMNTWDNTKNKMIFGRQDDVLLYLDKISSTLKCKIKPTADDIIAANGSTTEISDVVDITNNFPIQKWVYVTIVLDSAGIADFYLDGKLVKSVQNGNITNSTSSLQFGNGHDTYISKFERITKILGPSDVWSKYTKNNPGSSMKDSLGNYNVNLSILKDNVVTSSLSAF